MIIKRRDALNLAIRFAVCSYSGNFPFAITPVSRYTFGNVAFFHPSSFSRTEDVEHVLEQFLGDSYTKTAVSTWKPAEADENQETESKSPAYYLYVEDQNGDLVEGVSVNFCSDTASIPGTTDESGWIVFIGAPDVYHVQIVSVPDGYSWDKEDEIDTSDKGGKFIMLIMKD